MALIKCPECGTDVSDKAEKCPKCAYPLQASSYRESKNLKVTEVQLTSKKHKRRYVWAALAAVLGVILIFSGLNNNGETISPSFIIGLILLGFAVVYSVVVRAIKWWSHE
ncbi:MAG: zinc-ribbon domain-containing protein [Bacteroidales bacterium]|nr:zinc-ribbon domain-containing protein [Bacteroidales bacterium]